MPSECSIEWQLLNSRRGLAFLSYPANSSANIVKAFEAFGGINCGIFVLALTTGMADSRTTTDTMDGRHHIEAVDIRTALYSGTRPR